MFERPPENINEDISADEMARGEAMAAEFYQETEVPQENRRECGPEVAEYEDLLASFEQTHNLEQLHAIIELTPEDAPKNQLREPARLALYPIVTLLNTLKKETNIMTAKHDELKEQYMKLSRAVGMINNNMVDHNR